MNFNYHKVDFRGVDEPKENVATKPSEDAKGDNGRVYYGCRNDAEESELKSVHNLGKDGPVAVSKPADVKNGDLVSLLLAATPPYLYNIPLIPQTFFFSEMLKSFVQAKSERQNLKAQQTHHKRQRKRSWREMTPPKPTYYENSDKPLELTTPKQTEEKSKDRPPKSNFTAEKLANSSINSNSNSLQEGSAANSDLLPPTPPLWYPPLYPPHPPFGIDPLHFFIDLRVSAHVWDRKLAADKPTVDPALSASPLNLRCDDKDLRDKYMTALEPSLSRNRHKSAFSVPPPRVAREEEPVPKRSPHSVHYLMSNLKNIYKPKDGKREGENGEEDGAKKCKDLRALIGLELVVDYVKQESDGSDDEEQAETVNVEQIPEG
ncbi:UNVERIFIED_CONTAM: hypothetical protein PYX00_004433 [Menopon gallinae]|uniref:Uncharacterized protein n=1 Tax=Menopon gallinae TaxID=328185 RepID=A0AAW2I456_9NEOP